MDFDIADGKTNMHYNMKPVITNWLTADKEMEAYLSQMRSTKYDEKIVEQPYFFNAFKSIYFLF